MYFIGLSGIQGYDTVVWSSISGYKSGDLLQDNSGFFLCLGKDIVFPDLYIKQQTKEYTFTHDSKIYKHFLSQNTVNIIHRMVEHYFSSYKSVISLFLPTGIEERLPKKPLKNMSTKQICIIFPDLRTLTQHYPPNTLSDDTVILHGGMTQFQKSKVFWGIKSGSIKTLLATNRGLFFDWSHLNTIIVYNPTSWAYSGQSDPRFVIKEVAEKRGEIYGVQIEYRA